MCVICKSYTCAPASSPEICKPFTVHVCACMRMCMCECAHCTDSRRGNNRYFCAAASRFCQRWCEDADALVRCGEVGIFYGEERKEEDCIATYSLRVVVASVRGQVGRMPIHSLYFEAVSAKFICAIKSSKRMCVCVY